MSRQVMKKEKQMERLLKEQERTLNAQSRANNSASRQHRNFATTQPKRKQTVPTKKPHTQAPGHSPDYVANQYAAPSQRGGLNSSKAPEPRPALSEAILASASSGSSVQSPIQSAVFGKDKRTHADFPTDNDSVEPYGAGRSSTKATAEPGGHRRSRNPRPLAAGAPHTMEQLEYSNLSRQRCGDDIHIQGRPDTSLPTGPQRTRSYSFVEGDDRLLPAGTATAVPVAYSKLPTKPRENVTLTEDRSSQRCSTRDAPFTPLEEKTLPERPDVPPSSPIYSAIRLMPSASSSSVIWVGNQSVKPTRHDPLASRRLSEQQSSNGSVEGRGLVCGILSGHISLDPASGDSELLGRSDVVPALDTGGISDASDSSATSSSGDSTLMAVQLAT